MTPTAVTLDEKTSSQLVAANGHPVALCSPCGEVIGYYISPSRLAEAEREHREIIAELDRVWTPAAIARIAERSKNDPRPKRTMEEVLRMVEGE